MIKQTGYSKSINTSDYYVNINGEIIDDFQSCPDKISAEAESELSLAGQVLNLIPNISQDYDILTKLLTGYNKALSPFVSDDFKQSIENSIKCLPEITDKSNHDFDELTEILPNSQFSTSIDSLQKNTSSSFLVLPLLAADHLVGVVIRNLGNNLSVVLTDKSGIEKDKCHEFLIEPNTFKQIYFLYNKHTPIQSFRKLLKNFSNHHYALSFNSSPQKAGNCFVKELEYAVKYAFYTRDSSVNELKSNRKTLSRFITCDFRSEPIKWPVSTLEMHKRLVQNISPDPCNERRLKSYFEIYKRNKLFTKALKSGKTVKDALLLAFPHVDNVSTTGTFRYLTLYTISRYNKILYNYAMKNLNNDILAETIVNINKVFNSSPDEAYRLYHRHSNCFSNFLPVAKKEVSLEISSDYTNSSANNYFKGDIESAIVNAIRAISLEPNNRVAKQNLIFYRHENPQYDYACESRRIKKEKTSSISPSL